MQRCKTEILNEWTKCKSNIKKLQRENYDQNHLIEEFIDDFICVDNIVWKL